jgi:hypothetical protein
MQDSGWETPEKAAWDVNAYMDNNTEIDIGEGTKVWTGLNWFKMGSNGTICEYSNEYFRSVEGGSFLTT